MDCSLFGDIIQAAATIVSAIVIGIVLRSHWKIRSSVKEVVCRELRLIVAAVEKARMEVDKLYITNPVDYNIVVEVIASFDYCRQVTDIIETTLVRKLNDGQIPLYLQFVEAFNCAEEIARKLDAYFNQSGPLPHLDARPELSRHALVMRKMLLAIEISPE